MSNAKAVIFDMDGVIADSEWYIAEATRLMFKETHGVEISHDDAKPFTGQGENRFLGGVAEKYGVTGFDIERDKERTYVIYGELVRGGALKPLPGSIDFIRRCRELGLKTALATSADRTKMMINLEALGLNKTTMYSDRIGLAAAIEAAARNKVFDVMVNGLDVERQKPDPSLFLEAASRLEEDAAACWVVEDALSGIEAAKAAGMRCLALLTTFPEDKIKAAGPDKIAADLSAVTPEELL
ncbi:MAG: HAD-IA family hydrolase [Spirochaetaceae bacterium]|jgi:beta-phosphoglucomutase-like phosphatase (HAD superfamily)|nr:HAD-IA family hydrolase [Spirochaetaceae bacterium]